MRVAIVVQCVLLNMMLCVMPAIAGPFGTEMGEPIADFKDLKNEATLAPNVTAYTTTWMPKTSSMFRSYVLIFWENGLAKITAKGKANEHDGYGSKSTNQYDALKAQLTKKIWKTLKGL